MSLASTFLAGVAHFESLLAIGLRQMAIKECTAASFRYPATPMNAMALNSIAETMKTGQGNATAFLERENDALVVTLVVLPIADTLSGEHQCDPAAVRLERQV